MFDFIGSLIPGNDFVSKAINGASLAMLGLLGLAGITGIAPAGLIVVGYVVYCGCTGTPVFTRNALI